MDDNSDEYQTIEGLSEFQWKDPAYERSILDVFTCMYTVEILSIEGLYIPKSRKFVEEQHCRFDVICANLGIADKPTAKQSYGILMEKRMDEKNSLAAVEAETQRILGVLVLMERRSYMNVEPDLFEDEELDPDVQYMEELRCLLINLAKNPLSKILEQGESYLEIILLCGSRNVTNHFEIEIALIDVLIKMAITKEFQCIIVISDYKKHQEHFMSLGFTKVSEITYGAINIQSHQKKFTNTGASTSIMCFSLKLAEENFKQRRETQPDMKVPQQVRRPTRLMLNYS